MLKPEEMMQAQAALETLLPAGTTWRALQSVLADCIGETNQFANHPDTPEEKRSFWCGSERGLRDFASELEAVRSGQWRHRAEYREFFKRQVAKAEAEEEE